MRDDRPIWHNEFQYDKWDAFANGRTGEQQMAWERQQQRISVMRMEARMRDTTDHAAEAREAVRNVTMYASGLSPEHFRRAERYLAEVNDHVDALAAERNRYRDAVLAALQRYDRADAENGHTGFVRGEVAWAMADDLRQALDADR